MTIVTLTQPAFEPVSRAQAKDWMSIDSGDTSQDNVVDMLIKAMREDAENLTGRAFIQRTMRLYLSTWPLDCEGRPQFTLPFPPLISVESIKYRDIAGVLQTLATDQYVVHAWKEPGIVVPEWLVYWPYIRSLPDSIQISFTAGYAPGSPQDEAGAQEVMPAKLRLWMQAKAATLFRGREQYVTGNLVRVPRDFTDGLLDSLVIGTRLF